MIEKFEDLGFLPEDELEQVVGKVQEKLGVSLIEMQQALSEYVIKNAEKLTHEFVNIAPLGDYSKLLEDNDNMSCFLKEEAHKPEHWSLFGVRLSDVNTNLITFNFANKAVDDGNIFQGFVFVSLQGKIKHAFAQGE